MLKKRKLFAPPYIEVQNNIRANNYELLKEIIILYKGLDNKFLLKLRVSQYE